jgi:hypothetical protein
MIIAPLEELAEGPVHALTLSPRAVLWLKGSGNGQALMMTSKATGETAELGAVVPKHLKIAVIGDPGWGDVAQVNKEKGYAEVTLTSQAPSISRVYTSGAALLMASPTEVVFSSGVRLWAVPAQGGRRRRLNKNKGGDKPRVEIRGGVTHHIYPNSGNVGMASSGVMTRDTVYYATVGDTCNPSRVYAVPLAGGVPRPIYETGSIGGAEIRDIALDGETLYFCEFESTDSGDVSKQWIRRMALPSGSATTIAALAPEPTGCLSVMNGDLFWISGARYRTEGGAFKYLKAGSTQPKTLIANIRMAAADAHHFYFEGIDPEATGPSAKSMALCRVPRCSG